MPSTHTHTQLALSCQMESDLFLSGLPNKIYRFFFFFYFKRCTCVLLFSFNVGASSSSRTEQGVVKTNKAAAAVRMKPALFQNWCPAEGDKELPALLLPPTAFRVCHCDGSI